MKDLQCYQATYDTRPRFVARPHHFSPMWAVFDDLHGHAISARKTSAVATFIADSHEAIWCEQCNRWQQAEHRDGAP